METSKERIKELLTLLAEGLDEETANVLKAEIGYETAKSSYDEWRKNVLKYADELGDIQETGKFNRLVELADSIDALLVKEGIRKPPLDKQISEASEIQDELEKIFNVALSKVKDSEKEK